MRRRTSPPDPPPAAAAGVPPSSWAEFLALLQRAATHIIIDPNSVFTIEQARAALGLRAATIRRETRMGRLVVCRRAGRHYIIGADLLRWLRGGELRRGQAESNGQGGDGQLRQTDDG